MEDKNYLKMTAAELHQEAQEKFINLIKELEVKDGKLVLSDTALLEECLSDYLDTIDTSRSITFGQHAWQYDIKLLLNTGFAALEKNGYEDEFYYCLTVLFLVDNDLSLYFKRNAISTLTYNITGLREIVSIVHATLTEKENWTDDESWRLIEKTIVFSYILGDQGNPFTRDLERIIRKGLTPSSYGNSQYSCGVILSGLLTKNSTDNNRVPKEENISISNMNLFNETISKKTEALKLSGMFISTIADKEESDAESLIRNHIQYLQSLLD